MSQDSNDVMLAVAEREYGIRETLRRPRTLAAALAHARRAGYTVPITERRELIPGRWVAFAGVHLRFDTRFHESDASAYAIGSVHARCTPPTPSADTEGTTELLGTGLSRRGDRASAFHASGAPSIPLSLREVDGAEGEAVYARARVACASIACARPPGEAFDCLVRTQRATTRPMARAPTIEILEHGLVAGTWRDLAVFHWRGRSNVDAVRRCNDLGARLAASRPDGKIALLTVVAAAEITLPDAAMRREMDDGVERLTKSKKAEALVIESAGLVAATIRSIVAGTMLIRRSDFPTRVAATITDACQWLAKHLAPVAGKPIPSRTSRKRCGRSSRLPGWVRVSRATRRRSPGFRDGRTAALR